MYVSSTLLNWVAWMTCLNVSPWTQKIYHLKVIRHQYIPSHHLMMGLYGRLNCSQTSSDFGCACPKLKYYVTVWDWMQKWRTQCNKISFWPFCMFWCQNFTYRNINIFVCHMLFMEKKTLRICHFFQQLYFFCSYFCLFKKKIR